MKPRIAFLIVCLFAFVIGFAQQRAVDADMMAKPALLVVDMQNDFVREGAPMEVPDARKTITQNNALIAYCRKAGIPVIYTRFIGTPQRSLLWNWSPKIAPPLRACNKGYKRFYADVQKTLECTDVVDELKPLDGDVIIDKYGYGAFHETKLDSVLKTMGIQSLILTGTVTQICVEETGREAFHYGYKTTMVTDAVSSFMPDLHAAAIKNFGMKFGWCKTTDEVLNLLQHKR